MTRREWIAANAFLFSTLTACRRSMPTGYPGYALISTSADNSLGVVDLATFSLLKPIALTAPPSAVVPGPNASYALTPASGSIHAISGDLKVLRSQKLADELSEIRLTAGGERLFAIAARGRELIEADPETLKPLRRYRLGMEPAALDVAAPAAGSKAASYVAVSGGKGGTVELFDWAAGRRFKSELPRQVGAVRFRGDNQVLLAAGAGNPTLTAIAVPSLQVIVELPLGMQPRNLCFTPNGGQLFISGSGMDAVAIVFPFNTIEVDETILAGRDPGVMACTKTPLSYLFVGSGSGSDVCILDVATRAMIGVVDVGSVPTYIAITPDNQYALILDEAAGSMAAIRIPSIRRAWSNMAQRSGASLFTVLSVGDKPVHAAVVPRQA
ncbi:MAG: YncE family protein [Bryobacteraceae bacterium]